MNPHFRDNESGAKFPFHCRNSYRGLQFNGLAADYLLQQKLHGIDADQQRTPPMAGTSKKLSFNLDGV